MKTPNEAVMTWLDSNRGLAHQNCAQVLCLDDPFGISSEMAANVDIYPVDHNTQKDLTILKNFEDIQMLETFWVEEREQKFFSQHYGLFVIPNLSVLTLGGAKTLLQGLNSLAKKGCKIITCFPEDPRPPEEQHSSRIDLCEGVTNYNNVWVMSLDDVANTLWETRWEVEFKEEIAYPQMGRMRNVPGTFMVLRQQDISKRAAVESATIRPTPKA